ncbi:MAG: hypothetical protein A2V88_18110 [Elusimicrobia bacterium RBG_16_66_12]|nr:MAG: hypothetical protein A2V88_18110 [Elusimicrobia bacterium RBG_16_66_12]
MNQAWSSPCGFCAVPVLPATKRPGMFALTPVPDETTRRIASWTRPQASSVAETRPMRSDFWT